MAAADGGPRVDKVVTSGTFSIDGEDFDVDNNIWIVGDDSECVVIDAAHDHEPIVEGVAGRRVVAIICTHGHNDHIANAVDICKANGLPWNTIRVTAGKVLVIPRLGGARSVG